MATQLHKKQVTPEEWAVFCHHMDITPAYAMKLQARLGWDVVIVPSPPTGGPGEEDMGRAASGLLAWLETAAGQDWLAKKEQEGQVQWLRQGKQTLRQVKAALRKPSLRASLMEAYEQARISPG